MKKVELYGCYINYEDDAREATSYLENHLNQKEFQTIFNYARYHQKAYFQDINRRHFMVKYEEGEYFLTKE